MEYDEMNRKDAVEYLQRKSKISADKKIVEKKPVKKTKVKLKKEVTYEEPVFNKSEEKEITKVMKEGKIYGDPIAEIQW